MPQENDSPQADSVMRLRKMRDLWPEGLSFYMGNAAPREIYGRGKIDIMRHPRVAVFSSRRSPGIAILRTYDMARALREIDACVIGGFHSPMERESLDILLRGENPVIVCPARTIDPYQIPNKWQKAVDNGEMLLLSPFESKHRHQTRELARKRNKFVAALADLIVIAYADPGGMTEDIARQALEWGKPTVTFDIEDNEHLVEMGAEALTVDQIISRCQNDVKGSCGKVKMSEEDRNGG